MNDTELIEVQTELRARHDKVADILADVRKLTVSGGREAADLGDYMMALKASGMHTLPDWFQEDVTRVAGRALSARRRGLLDDPAQLTFILTGDGITPRIAPAQKRTHNEVMEATTKIHAVRLYLREMADKVPVERWDAGMRQAIKADLEPLVEMWKQL